MVKRKKLCGTEHAQPSPASRNGTPIRRYDRKLRLEGRRRKDGGKWPRRDGSYLAKREISSRVACRKAVARSATATLMEILFPAQISVSVKYNG